MGYTNAQCAEILNVSIPTVKRFLKYKTKFTAKRIKITIKISKLDKS